MFSKKEPKTFLTNNVYLELHNGELALLVDKDSGLPFKTDIPFSTAEDNQESIPISLYQGLDNVMEKCTAIGEFSIHEIPPAKKGKPMIMLSINIMENGELVLSTVYSNKTLPVSGPRTKLDING